MRLLSKLRSQLSVYLSVWNTFIGPGGDYEYFLDMKVPEAVRAFDSITECFRLLSERLEKLNTLYTSCQDDATIVSNSFNTHHLGKVISNIDPLGRSIFP
jgi:hypothetical protein